ncbi:MAG: PD-(D/E)XK nuclease family protein [Oscillospiraceae bacterium]|nr:PD-(D/E)XK nuclease family protein [Oscillospiraceae bacterium]
MINIIYGQAQSGKTTRIMEQIRDIVQSPAPNAGLRAILVVPEQYSHAAERQLLETCGDSLSLYAETLSFTRLASRALDELGLPSRFMSGGGRLLTLYRALTERADALRVYGGASPRAEFLSPLDATLRELKNSRVTSELLTAAAERADDNANRNLGAKLRDLAILLESTDALAAQSGVIDASDAVSRLAEVVRDTSFASATFFFDGFNDFTEPEFAVVQALIRHGADMTFCLTCDDLAAGGDAFELTRHTARRITRECETYAIPCEITKIDGGASPDTPAPAVELLRAPDALTECEYAAAIALNLAKSGLRWREIAVFSRGGGYDTAAERTLTRYGVPVFRAGRDDVTVKPPIRLTLAALDVALSGWDADTVLTYLKTGLIGLDDAETDRLENYARAQGVRGEQWARKKPWAFSGNDALDADADGLRRRVAEPLRQLVAALRRERECGGKLRALYAFFEEIELPQTLQRRESELRGRDMLRLADEYRQLWDILVSALDELYAAAANYAVSDAEFRKLLSLVLSQYDVGVIPVALDRVTVGEFSRSRRRDLKALIILGATDELIPAITEPSGVLSRAERETAAKLDLQLGDGAETAALREENVIYSTLTLPSRILYIVYPESARPSHIVARLAKSYDATVATLDPPQYLAAAPIPYREYLAITDETRVPPPIPQPLAPQSVTALYGEVLRLSATSVETRVQCAFKFFLNYGLRLRPRREFELDAPQSGTFVHHVLERVAQDAATLGGFAEIDDDAVTDAARRASDAYFSETLTAFDERGDRFRQLYLRLARDTERVAIDLARELRQSDFAPLAFESRFETAVTDALTVRGVIDRVDTLDDGTRRLVRVSDYKTGLKSFRLQDFYYGLNLQMLIYLYALGRSSEILPHDAPLVPSAALYIPARDVNARLPRSASEHEVEVELAKRLQRQGFLLNDGAVIDALEHGHGAKTYLPVKVTGDGEYVGDNVLPPERIDALTLLAERRLRGVGDAVVSGDVAPRPYSRDGRTPCEFCDFRAACTFGASGADKPRYLPKLKIGEFWDKVDAEVDE